MSLIFFAFLCKTPWIFFHGGTESLDRPEISMFFPIFSLLWNYSYFKSLKQKYPKKDWKIRKNSKNKILLLILNRPKRNILELIYSTILLKNKISKFSIGFIERSQSSNVIPRTFWCCWIFWSQFCYFKWVKLARSNKTIDFKPPHPPSIF